MLGAVSATNVSSGLSRDSAQARGRGPSPKSFEDTACRASLAPPRRFAMSKKALVKEQEADVKHGKVVDKVNLKVGRAA